MKKVNACGITLTFANDTCNVFACTAGGTTFRWSAAPYIHFSDGRKIIFPAPAEITEIENGVESAVETVYTGFDGSEIKAVALSGIDKHTGEVFFSVNITGDKKGEIDCVSYPGPVSFADDDSEYTVLSRMQGAIMPKGCGFTVERGIVFERDAYMPMYGQVTKRGAYLAVYDTPYDACYRFENDEVTPLWVTSLGKMSYPRRMVYRISDGGDYNDIAHAYRDYVKQKGRLVTLKEKAVRNPAIRKLYGCPVIHEGIAIHISPESDFYRADDADFNDNYVSFDTRAEQLRALKKRGLEKAYTHFDGWGKHGYDNLHPDPFPPHVNAGGTEGMRRLSDTARECGYMFGIHDQYRDFYYDSPDFDLNEAIQNIDGTNPYCSVWNGGRHSFLCASKAAKYVRRNYDRFEKLGIGIDGSYLDVFSVVGLDECFSERHPMTRRECAEARRECLDILSDRGIIPSSEETIDCIIPSMALCHHAPFRTKELGGMQSERVGIQIPLFSLVYHDCIVIPWIGLPGETGGWGIPKGDSAYLYAILMGYPVYCPIDADETALKAVKTACESAERLAETAMIKHEFIDGNVRRQRAIFADGTVTEVDFDNGTYEIKPAL